MKCQNCNSELLEDAKFCTTCGTPSPLRPQARVPEMQSPDAARRQVLHDAARRSNPPLRRPQAPDGQAAGGGELATVKQKIFWNIQKGEVACRVNEAELIRYDSAQG